MNSRAIDIDRTAGELGVFVGASKKALGRGDHLQAERLLKTSLRRSEDRLFEVLSSTRGVIENLIELYKLQDRETESEILQARLNHLNELCENATMYRNLLQENRKAV